MFTGIVQETGIIIQYEQSSSVLSYVVQCPELFLQGIELGASVSVSGICQTLVNKESNKAHFQAVAETLQKTNLSQIFLGQKVNLERSLKIGDEVGGHLLSGHIMGTGSILHITQDNFTKNLEVEVSPSLAKFIFSKGFIGLEGISLTIGEKHDNSFTLHLIPETLARTNLNQKVKGSMLNIEIDFQTQIIVQTVESWLERKHEKSSV